MQIYSSRLRKLLVQGGGYGLFKSSGLLAPLAIAATASVELYASIESVIATSSFLVIMVNFGVCAAIPLYELKENRPDKVALVYLHVLFMAIVTLLSGIGLYALGYEFIALLLVSVSVFALLRLLSSHAKTRSEAVWSGYYDSIFYLVLLLFAFLSMFLGVELPSLILMLNFTSICLVAVALRRFCREEYKFFSWKCLADLYGFSGGALVVGVFIALAINFLKIFGLLHMGEVEFSKYAFGFRVFSIAVFVFQLFMTVKYRYMYGQSASAVDRASMYVYFVCIGMCLCIALAYKRLSMIFLEGELQSAVFLDTEYWVFIVVMPVWCMSAILENIIARERLILKHLRILLVGLVPVTIVGYVAMDSVGMSYGQLVFGHSFYLAGFVLSQLWCLRRSGLVFGRVEVIILCTLAVSVFGAYIST